MNRSAREGKSVKRFERSNGPDIALYKNYLYLLPYIFVLQMLFKEVYRKGTVQSTFSQQSDKSAGGAVNTT